MAGSLNSLAGFYNDQGRFAEAELFYRRALDILEKALGPRHPEVAASLEGYAQVLRKLKRKAEASKLEDRAKALLAK